jgi:hypothetical protein
MPAETARSRGTTLSELIRASAMWAAIAPTAEAGPDYRGPVVSASQPIGGAVAGLVMEPSLRAAPVCLPVSLPSSGHLTS